MAYSDDIKAEAKRLIVIEQMTPADAAKRIPPAASTIAGWAREEDADGQDWYALRKERAERLFTETSPQATALKLLGRIDRALNEGDFSNKEADSLAKYTAVLKTIADPKYQVHVLYQFLNEWVAFVKTQYPDLFDERMAAAIKDYKNELRTRLGKPT